MIDWDKVDREFRGDVNEDGLRWDADFLMYTPDDFVHTYCIYQDEQGEWQGWYILHGGGTNVVITEGDEKKFHPTMPDYQEWYQWLYENRRVENDATGY